jgi:opacity protein-like surface antigen
MIDAQFNNQNLSHNTARSRPWRFWFQGTTRFTRYYEIGSNLKHLVYAALISILSFIPHQSFAAPLWYAGGSLGYTNYDSDDIERDLANRQVPGSSALDDDKIPWHIFVGYQHNNHVALELGYQYLDRQAGTTVLDSQPTVSAKTSRETDGFMLGINGILPLNDKYTAQVMGGIYLWHIVTAVNSLSGGGAIAINFDDRTSTSYKGLGIQYALNSTTALHVQWLNFNIDNEHANILNIGFTHDFLVMEE